jgi:hypothetical protein
MKNVTVAVRKKREKKGKTGNLESTPKTYFFAGSTWGRGLFSFHFHFFQSVCDLTGYSGVLFSLCQPLRFGIYYYLRSQFSVSIDKLVVDLTIS